MRALIVPAAGTSPVISDIAVPQPGPGEVLLRVRAAGLNAIDNAIAAGYLAEMLPHSYPLVIGRDAAGVVEAVGEGVEGFSAGDEVIGHVRLAPPIQAGTVAEYAVLSTASLVHKPAALSWEHAAALPLAGAAAAASVDAVKVSRGQTVLVSGATGGVGSYVVQLLAAEGITVIATGASGDVERLVSLGAAHVVDYTAGDVAEQTLGLVPGGVDALIELAHMTADTAPLRAVKAGGSVFATTQAADADALAAAGLTGATIMANPVSDVVGVLVARAAEQDLRIDISTVLPLEQAAEGLATLGSGQARGKIVVRISE